MAYQGGRMNGRDRDGEDRLHDDPPLATEILFPQTPNCLESPVESMVLPDLLLLQTLSASFFRPYGSLMHAYQQRCRIRHQHAIMLRNTAVL